MGGQASVPAVVDDALRRVSQADQKQLQSMFDRAASSPSQQQHPVIPLNVVAEWLSLTQQGAACLLQSWRKHFEVEAAAQHGAPGMDRNLFTVTVSTVSGGTSMQRSQLFAALFWCYGHTCGTSGADSTARTTVALTQSLNQERGRDAARKLVLHCFKDTADKRGGNDTESDAERLQGYVHTVLFEDGDTVLLNQLARRCVADAVCMRLCDHALAAFALPSSKLARRAPLVQPAFASSSLLSPEECMAINEYLPASVRNEWSLLFSGAHHGSSFAKFKGSIEEIGATVIVVRDRGGHVFGGFAPHSWSLQSNFYGNEECFLFSARPHLHFYPTNSHNHNFQYFNLNSHSRPNGLGFGGQFEYFGLFIAADMMRGHSKGHPCSTFSNEPLSSTEDFEIDVVEAWRVGPLPQSLEAKGQSVLDGNKEDQMLLELHGRKMHSRDIRKADKEKKEETQEHEADRATPP